jgi:[ribosomal protein S5]-alanine N-acetyltransferase
MTVLETPRLLLIQATTDSLHAELQSRAALGETLGVEVPESWPPELYDADAVRWTIAWLAEDSEHAEWSLYYVAETPGEAAALPRLVGVAGYKGGPDAAGVVELGYGIVPERRRRGFASEAVRCLVSRAFADPRVATVIAHTLPELTPSIGVLRVTGFSFDGPGNDPHEPTAIRYVMPRQRFDQLRVEGAAYSASPAVSVPRPAAT